MSGTIWRGERSCRKTIRVKASRRSRNTWNAHFSAGATDVVWRCVFFSLHLPRVLHGSVRLVSATGLLGGLRRAPGIVESRGSSVGSVPPPAGSCYMVTVIFVVCLGIVFTALHRINNCHKRTSSPACRPLWTGRRGGAWRLGRKACVHDIMC